MTTAATRPRICLNVLEYPPRPGGLAVAAGRLARSLVFAGYEVHVVAPVARAGASGEVETRREDEIVVHRVAHADPNGTEGQFALRQHLRQLDDAQDFRLFHGFFLPAAYPCLAVAARDGRARPVIASIRGADVLTLLEQPLFRAWLLPVLRKASWITSVNQTYLDRVAEEVPIDGRSSVIRNGIAPLQGLANTWQLTDANRGHVGTVGEFRKVKDIPLLVRAYAATPATWRRGLLLAGYFATDAADEAEWTSTLIDEFNLRAETELSGPFPHADVPAYLRRMHVYVQSSGSEGLPNALLEAAVAGVPLVATAVGGMKEILTDGVTGLLVPHGDVAAMSAAITRVLSDDTLAARLSAGAMRLAGELSEARERDAWTALYARLCQR